MLINDEKQYQMNLELHIIRRSLNFSQVKATCMFVLIKIEAIEMGGKDTGMHAHGSFFSITMF